MSQEVNTRDQELIGLDPLVSDVFPAYLFFQNYTVFNVVFHYKNGSGSSSSFSQMFQFNFDTLTFNGQEQEINGVNLSNFGQFQFDSNYDYLMLSINNALGITNEQLTTLNNPTNENFIERTNILESINQTFLTRNYVIPFNLQDGVGLIKTNEFLNILENNYFKYIRALQSTMVTYRKIEINILMPLGFPSPTNVALNSYTKVETFTLIFNSGITGMLPSDNYIKTGALEFLIYPKDENLLHRKTAAYNKPSRLLVRGCAEPISSLKNNSNLQRFLENYPLDKRVTIELAKTQPARIDSLTIDLIPKISLLNDNFRISMVQCTGYSRVAGQKNISPLKLEDNSVLMEENLSRQNNVTTSNVTNSQVEGGGNE